MEFKLYSYYRSSCSYRVRIALEYKQINYTYIPVHLLENGGHQNTAEYQKINSKKEVPTLIHNESPISQSMAIFEYLDEVSPEKSLFPKTSLERAYVRQACEIINSGIQPLQNLWVINKLASDYKISDDQKKVWINDVVNQGLHSFEKFISNKAGKFCFGDELTAADMFLVPQIYSATRFGVDLSSFSILSKINGSCLLLEPFKKAHPDHQPDTPK
jgi:maleylacetoacetate isomerase